jgi:hypothetical protein
LGAIDGYQEIGFGFEHLEQVITAGPQTSAAAMLEHLRLEIASFISETTLRDDIVIVALPV